MADEKKKKVDEASEAKVAVKKEDKKEEKKAEKTAEVKKEVPAKEEPKSEAPKKEEPKKEEPKKESDDYAYVDKIRLWQNADIYNTIPQVFSGNVKVVAEVSEKVVKVEHMLPGFGLIQSFALKADVCK